MFKSWLFIAMLAWGLSGCATYQIVSVPGIKVTGDIEPLDCKLNLTEKETARLYVNRLENKLLAVDSRPVQTKAGFFGWYGLTPGKHTLQVQYQFGDENQLSATDPAFIEMEATAGRRYILVAGLNSLQDPNSAKSFAFKNYAVKDITHIEALVNLMENQESYVTRSVFLSVLYAMAPEPSVYRDLGKTSQVKDAFEQIELLNRVIRARPRLWVPYYLRAAAYTRSDQKEKNQLALSDLAQVITLNPKCASAYYELGKISEATDRNRAIAYFKQAIDLGDAYSEYYLNRQLGIEYPLKNRK